MIMILLKSLGKRTSIGSYYDEKSLTKCYCPRPHLALLCKHKKMLHNETWKCILKEKAVIL